MLQKEFDVNEACCRKPNKIAMYKTLQEIECKQKTSNITNL